jgi:hypothetical protein
MNPVMSPQVPQANHARLSKARIRRDRTDLPAIARQVAELRFGNRPANPATRTLRGEQRGGGK